MEFWQYILTFVTAILMALFLGTSAAYLNIRFIRKDDQVPFSQLLRFLFRSNPKILSANAGVLSAPHNANKSTYTPSTPQKSRELIDFMAPELAEEFEYNRISGALFSGNRMLPLQTAVWDAHQEWTHELPAYIRNELEKFYADIKTLNNLVWLSTKLNSQSTSLTDYRNLLDQVVQRANRIKHAVVSGPLK